MPRKATPRHIPVVNRISRADACILFVIQMSFQMGEDP